MGQQRKKNENLKWKKVWIRGIWMLKLSDIEFLWQDLFEQCFQQYLHDPFFLAKQQSFACTVGVPAVRRALQGNASCLPLQNGAVGRRKLRLGYTGVLHNCTNQFVVMLLFVHRSRWGLLTLTQTTIYSLLACSISYPASNISEIKGEIKDGKQPRTHSLNN